MVYADASAWLKHILNISITLTGWMKKLHRSPEL